MRPQDETVSSSSALLYHLESEVNTAQRKRKMTKIVLVAALAVVALMGFGAQFKSFDEGKGDGLGVSLRMEKKGSAMSPETEHHPNDGSLPGGVAGDDTVTPTTQPTMQPTASPTGSLTYSGQHEVGFLSEGQSVLIKSMHGGYLVDNDDGTLSTKPEYVGSTEEENMVFVVEAGATSNSYKFRNLATGKHLKGTSGNLQSSVVNGSGLGASWKKDTDVFSSSTGKKQRYFGQLRSRYFQTKCASAASLETATVAMATCADSVDQYFTFEIL